MTREAFMVTIMLFIGVGVGAIMFYAVRWYAESPVFDYRSIRVAGIAKGDVLRVFVRANVINHCTYLVEHNVWQRQRIRGSGSMIYNVKLHGGRDWRAAPPQLGARDYVIPIVLDVLPERGPAYYEERIGSVCNPLRMIWPIWTQWQTAYFNVINQPVPR